MSIIVLYSYFRSSCSWRVRLALQLKGLKYEYKAINLLKSEQTTEEYTTFNPLQSVPTLFIDDHKLCQSVAIIEYLEETRPTVSLLPKDPYKKALVRQIVQSIASDIQPVQNLRVLKKVGEDKKAEWAKYWIEYGLKGVEKTLSSTAGTYCVDDEISMADICLVPQVYNAIRYNVDMSQFPIISRINETLGKLPEFQMSHPDAQPDAQK